MRNICLKQTFGHIDGFGKRIAYKVYRTTGCNAHAPFLGGKPDILGALLFRWVVFIAQRPVQQNLHTAEQTVHPHGGDQDTRGTIGKVHCPFAILSLIKARDALQCAAFGKKSFRQSMTEE